MECWKNGRVEIGIVNVGRLEKWVPDLSLHYLFQHSIFLKGAMLHMMLRRVCKRAEISRRIVPLLALGGLVLLAVGCGDAGSKSVMRAAG